MKNMGCALVQTPHIKFSEQPLHYGTYGGDKYDVGIPSPISADAQKVKIFEDTQDCLKTYISSLHGTHYKNIGL
jgi:hypothetical protein